MKELELDIFKYKMKAEESGSKLKALKLQFESVRNERNLCNKSVVTTNVSDDFATEKFTL